MVWSCHDISYFHFYLFVFKTNGKKEDLDENNFCYCYGNFFESAALKVSYLITTMFKVFSRQLRGTFRDTLQLKILRKWTNIGVNSSLVKNIMKQKLAKVPRKQSDADTIQVCPSKNIAPTDNMKFRLLFYATFTLEQI